MPVGMSDLGGGSPPAPEMTGDSRLRFGVLGAFRVERDGREVDPGRPPRAPARVLVTQDPGYVLRVADDQVDALLFQALVRKAHNDLASDEALDLASGKVLPASQPDPG